jgi:hypothetical protein
MGRLLRRGGACGEPDVTRRLPRPRSLRLPREDPPAYRRLAVFRIAALGLAAGLVLQAQVPALALTKLSVLGSDAGGRTPAGRSGGPSVAVSGFSQITLPDLLIVAPKGLTAAQVARLGAIPGMRDLATFDGAEMKVGGVSVSVIGVNPSTLRSWVPLRAASDQAFWTALADGEFVAQTAASTALQLKAGAEYELTGASSLAVRFGAAAELGLSGVDVLVNQSLSARLGLVRQVVGLISAPGIAIATLHTEVAQVLGPSGRIEVLRSQQVSAAAPEPASSGSAGARSTSGQPTTYLELFRASAADYCPGLSWTVLAAIGQIESADGENMGPSSAGALGPMQFLPSTWQVWGIDAFGQTGPPNVLNAYDAVPSAARMLCADGAAAGGAGLASAIYDYNHAEWYVNEVLALAAQYAADYA